MEGESLVKKEGEQGPSKGRQIFLYIGPFPLWRSSRSGPPPEGTLELVSCGLRHVRLLRLRSGAGRRWDKPTYFDWAVGAYFLVLSLIPCYVAQSEPARS